MSSSEEHSYEVNIAWKEGRIGTMDSPALDDKLDVATPPEFPGGVDGVWSPEHLFTASVSSCFLTSFTAVAEYSKFEFEDLKINSSGKMSRDENGKFVMSEVTIKATLTISDEAKEKKAYRLLEKAEEICLITRSIKADVIVVPVVKVEVAA
ncbi:OsmC family protein [Rhodohalobacter sp.]|uniref:OsmC family protein n=1 Tax=Rhodohalobacter sp. TaxID=1974210 RepID=UPI002ACE4664|nr:OsmC family protein [Rhodohalobacter sp.]MDZ7758058.1 OsmC family protein [Rhodohalobacter sp.]